MTSRTYMQGLRRRATSATHVRDDGLTAGSVEAETITFEVAGGRRRHARDSVGVSGPKTTRVAYNKG